MIGTGDLLDAYLEWERDWQDQRRAERYATRAADGRVSADWWASSLGKCYRIQLARKLGIPPTRGIDLKTRRTFSWGNLIESFIRKIHYRAGIVKGSQTYLTDPDLSVSAKLDIVTGGPVTAVDDIPADTLAEWTDDWVLFLRHVEKQMHERFEAQLNFGAIWAKEIKSAKSFKMQRLVDEGEPDFSWRMQVGVGMLLAERHPEQLEEQGVPPITNWVVEAVGRDAVGVLTFPAEESWRDEAEQRLAVLNHLLPRIKTGEVQFSDVACECSNTWMVEYCDYQLGEVARDTSDNRVSHWTQTFACCGGGGTNTRELRKQDRRDEEVAARDARLAADKAAKQAAKTKGE